MDEKSEKITKFTKRSEKDFNIWRRIWQWLCCDFFYNIRFVLVYRLEVHGRENIPKDNNYIVAANHLSTLDPVLLAKCNPRPIAFMAKKELFENMWLSWMLDWLGTFAVNREKLGVSTIKTAMSIKNTQWVLGLFPQGTREEPGKITKITKGFAGLAKATKCGIMPVGIIGTDEVKRIPFSGKIIVKYGKLIPYSKNADEMFEKWTEAIQELTGFTYEPVEESAEE